MACCCRFYGAVLLVMAICCLNPLLAEADSIQIGGAVRTTPFLGVPDSYTLVVSSFGYQEPRTTDFFFLPIPGVPTSAEQMCSPCAAGQVIDVSNTFVLGGAGFVGFGQFGGVAYPQVFGEGQLTFDVSPLTVPVASSPVLFPFTATGSLRFFDLDTSHLLFDSAVFGSGIGLLTLVGSPGGPYSFYNINYPLNDPVPEPGSFVLVGTGALVLTRRLRTHPALR